MPDPMASIAEEAASGATVTPDGEMDLAPEGPSVGDRVIELFRPCPEDPLSKKGFVSQTINGVLAKRSGVPVEQIEVGENVAHCVDHLFPGSASGLPPILNLVKSVIAYRDAARKHPDNGNLVRQ